MHSVNILQLGKALIVSGFAIFSFGFSHVGFQQPAMAAMEGLSGHAPDSVRCQVVCTTAVKDDGSQQLANPEPNDKDWQPNYVSIAAVSLLLIALAFIVKLVRLLSSWKPPDRVLLCGHLADGL